MIDQLPSRLEIQAERCRRSLYTFAREAFAVIEPGTPFYDNWHLQVICEHLEAVSRREVLRLIINVPPRHMKSLLVAVIWPAWEWLDRPEAKFMFVSYAERLSLRDSTKCRRLIRSAGTRFTDGAEHTLLEHVGYQGLLQLLVGRDHFELTSDQDAKGKFENDRMGYRLATSIGGTATGEGGDYVVMDDPHKAAEAEKSEVERQAVLDFQDGTLSTRFNDPKRGAEVVIMQRLHELDLSGYLLERGGWTHLCLPAEYEPAHPFVWPEDPRTEAGELLWPERIGKPELDTLKKALRFRAAGQLQQRPAPAEGILFKRKDMRYWTTVRDGLAELYVLRDGPDETRRIDKGQATIFQVADVAASDKETADWTVVTTFAATRSADLIVLDVARQRFDELEVPTFIESASDKWDRPPMWIEAFGAGRAALKRLKRDGYPAMELLQEHGSKLDKIARAFEGYTAYEDHKVFHPLEAEWLVRFEDELATFPAGAHDDQVDTVSYGARLRVTIGQLQEMTEPVGKPLGAGIMDAQF